MALVSQRKRPHSICGIRLDYGVQVYEQYRISPFPYAGGGGEIFFNFILDLLLSMFTITFNNTFSKIIHGRAFSRWRGFCGDTLAEIEKSLNYFLDIYCLRKLFWGRHFSPVLPVSRYTSSDAGCSTSRFSGTGQKKRDSLFHSR
jgi:hypothetical protein